MFISLVIVVVIAVLAVFFASYNQVIIQVNLFGYLVQGPTGLFLVITLGIGLLLGVLLMLPSIIGRSWMIMKHKRRVRELEDAISNQKQVEPIEEEGS